MHLVTQTKGVSYSTGFHSLNLPYLIELTWTYEILTELNFSLTQSKYVEQHTT